MAVYGKALVPVIILRVDVFVACGPPRVGAAAPWRRPRRQQKKRAIEVWRR